MRLLPSRRFVVETALSPEEARRRLDPLVLAPAGLMLAGAALVAASFGGEARRALDALATVAKATRAALD